LPTHSIAAADKGQLEQHLGHTCDETRSNNRVPSLRDSSNTFVSSLLPPYRIISMTVAGGGKRR
jgi:hypothetical protein